MGKPGGWMKCGGCGKSFRRNDWLIHTSFGRCPERKKKGLL